MATNALDWAKEKIKEFEGLLMIDKEDLDHELVGQSSAYWQVGQAYAQAQSEVESAKDHLKETDAALYLELRDKKEKEKEKFSESVLNNGVLLDRRHVKAAANLRQWQSLANQLGFLKDAWSQRSYMLRDLCQLFMASYYTPDSVSGKSEREVRDVSAGNKRAKLNEARQRVRKKSKANDG